MDLKTYALKLKQELLENPTEEKGKEIATKIERSKHIVVYG